MHELPPVNVALLADALRAFLAEELRASGLDRYVVGLSGGVDSAAAAALAVSGLGPEKVHAVALPGPTSSPASLEDAREVARTLGVELEVVEIAGAARALAEALGAGEHRLRWGNVMARLRMIALFDRARTLSGLVLGTGNKSELLLGYTTLFGDNASSVNPLYDVWKTNVFELAAHLGVPRRVVEKEPTADLWSGQTDAGELGFSYAEADAVLYWHHDRGLDRDALVARGLPVRLVETVLDTYRRNRFKWRPTVAARVSASCVNVDRILPRNPER